MLPAQLEGTQVSVRRLREDEEHGGRFGDVARGGGGEDFDDVFAEFAVEDAVAAGAEEDIAEDAVDVNVAD